MIKVGLIGEDPHDTSSIKNLLSKGYKGKVNFYPLVKGLRGGQLDSAKIKRTLPIEFKDTGCHFMIYIRDLDGYKTEKEKIAKIQKWVNELDAAVGKKGISLINIWELEALILADIEAFNKLYKTALKYSKNPMSEKDPKKLLKTISEKGNKRYTESHCPQIFEKLNIKKLESNCQYFKEFISAFDKKIKAISN